MLLVTSKETVEGAIKSQPTGVSIPAPPLCITLGKSLNLLGLYFLKL